MPDVSSQLNGEVVVPKLTIDSLINAPPHPILPRSTRKLKLLDIDSTEMARQLTLLEFNLFKRIRMIDCLHQMNGQKAQSSPVDNISVIIDHTNKVRGALPRIFSDAY
jgi:son of sevenless-like protein